MSSEQRDVVKVSCNNCGARYGLPRQRLLGRVLKIRCKQCREVFEVRGDEQPESAAAPQSAPAKEAPAGGRPDGQLLSRGARRWFAVVDRKRLGPITEQEIRDRFDGRKIGPRTFLWRQGMSSWKRLAELDEFSDLGAGRADRKPAGASSAGSAPAGAATPIRAGRREDSEVSTLVAPDSLLASDLAAARRADGPAAEPSSREDAAPGEPSFEPGGLLDGGGRSNGEDGADAPIGKASTGEAPKGYPAAGLSGGDADGRAESEAPLSLGAGAPAAAVAADRGAVDRDRAQDGSALDGGDAPPTEELLEYAAGASHALKAQRQESSVLFALDNLVALADEKPAGKARATEPEPEPIAIVPSRPPRELSERTGIEPPPPSELVLRGEQERTAPAGGGAGRLLVAGWIGVLIGAGGLAGTAYLLRPDVVDALVHGADLTSPAAPSSAAAPEAVDGAPGGSAAGEPEPDAGGVASGAAESGPGEGDGSGLAGASSASPDGRAAAKPAKASGGAARSAGRAGTRRPSAVRRRPRADRSRSARRRPRKPAPTDNEGQGKGARQSRGGKKQGDEIGDSSEEDKAEKAGKTGKGEGKKAGKADKADKPDKADKAAAKSASPRTGGEDRAGAGGP